MKKSVGYLALLLVFVLLVGSVGLAASNPQREAKKVHNVSDPYTPDDWVIESSEKLDRDPNVTNVLECDINGVIACYDKKFLRVDILLNNSITYKWKVFYSVKFEYDSSTEYYTYYPDTKEMVYEEMRNGKIVTSKVLDTTKSEDRAGVTNSGDIKNSDVYLIINKNEHIAGTKGKRYYLTTSFSSGYLDKQNKLHTVDETIDVDMYFVK